MHTYVCDIIILYLISNIAVMDDNSVATLRDEVDFKLETVSALGYHVQNPSQPQ